MTALSLDWFTATRTASAKFRVLPTAASAMPSSPGFSSVSNSMSMSDGEGRMPRCPTNIAACTVRRTSAGTSRTWYALPSRLRSDAVTASHNGTPRISCASTSPCMPAALIVFGAEVNRFAVEAPVAYTASGTFDHTIAGAAQATQSAKPSAPVGGRSSPSAPSGDRRAIRPSRAIAAPSGLRVEYSSGRSSNQLVGAGSADRYADIA